MGENKKKHIEMSHDTDNSDFKSDPLVSIIVISYNSSKFIEETLESCRSQCYDNIELIISDDASTDETIQVCREWLNQHGDRFIYYEIIEANENTGVAGNLNRGVEASNGAFFKLIAGDDLLLDNCISDNVDFIKSSRGDISVVSSLRLRFQDNNNGERIITRPDSSSIFFHPDITAEDQYELALRRISPPINTYFIEKDAYINVGGCDEEFPMYEDKPLLLRLLAGGYKIHWLESETVLYRVHNESIFHKDSNNKIYTDWTLNYRYPVYFQYIYPNVTWIEKLIIYYQYILAKITVSLGLNHRNKINWVINKLFYYPVNLLYKGKRNRIRRLFENKYAK